MTAPKHPKYRLNALCPYFTMFPLDFPLRILERRGQAGDSILDPFCGRGTTNFAARLLGLNSLGVDSSPIAAAITAAKMAQTTSEAIINEATTILATSQTPRIPQGEFWEWAYHPTVLEHLCRLREALLTDCSTPARIALRGVILGALHGPKSKIIPSYFSNQCPRTYAPKPAYSVSYWQTRNLTPNNVDVIEVIRRRAERFYTEQFDVGGMVQLGDSRSEDSFRHISDRLFNWVITSPPYYGMRTYIPDQWLRNWFLGGSDTVDYSQKDQLLHQSPHIFVTGLQDVWKNVAEVCTPNASMVIRFGGIPDRRADPIALIKASLKDTPWKITTIHHAGSATEGKRQADSFLRKKTTALAEYDVWARMR